MPEKGPEVVNAAHRIDLFSNVVVAEDDHGVRFKTPERILESEKYGSFAFSVSGQEEHFKEHDHYGQIRFLQRDNEVSGGIWVPHLFPFEDVSPHTHLPDILERQRCSFVMTLRKLEEGARSAPHPYEVAIHAQQGIFAAMPNIGLSLPGQDTFDEFHWYTHDAIGQRVEWPVETPPSVVEFLGELMVSDPERFHRLVRDEEDMPDEFEKSREPLGYETREPWANESELQAFGAIWTPVDELRRGIDAQVEFVMFQR
jgi:hypothetical protein